jgi:hypothetical protein
MLKVSVSKFRKSVSLALSAIACNAPNLPLAMTAWMSRGAVLMIELYTEPSFGTL